MNKSLQKSIEKRIQELNEINTRNNQYLTNLVNSNQVDTYIVKTISVTATCRYLALRLDKFYSGPLLNKSWFFRFEGLYLLTVRFDVDPLDLQAIRFALVWIRCDPLHTSLTLSSRVTALQL